MDAIIFTGPTLPAAEVEPLLPGALCRPPAAQGDVLRAALLEPLAIGIIDGYFEQIPSIWHKEILWAMSRGVHVFGSASMGALRAAELEPFGMRGVGRIFEAFRDGALEDDDEVAVVHAAAEHGYRPLAEAMVNIRATLERAESEGVIGAGVRAGMERIAKSLFYKHRSYPRLIEIAREALEEQMGEIEAFRRWIRHGAVDRKREDAAEMLASMRQFLDRKPQRMQVDYPFEETVFWHVFQATTPAVSGEGADAAAAVLAELKADPELWRRFRDAALGWWILKAGRQASGSVSAVNVLAQSALFCRTHGLSEAEDVETWIAQNHASRAQLDRILERSALAEAAWQSAGAAGESALLDYLRWTGEYERLLERARQRSQEA